MVDEALQCHIKPEGNEESTLYSNDYIARPSKKENAAKEKVTSLEVNHRVSGNNHLTS